MMSRSIRETDPRSVTQAPSSITGSLLEQVRAGDPEGWRRFVFLYAPVILSLCRGAGLREHDAEEVAQDVFQTVAVKIGSFRAERPGSPLRAWLRLITRNKIGDHYRRASQQPEAAGGSDAQELMAEVEDDLTRDSDDTGDRMEHGLLCRRALELIRDEFQASSWQAFWRVVIDGQSAAEAAIGLGLTPNAVYIAKSRILGRLRELLLDLGESDLGRREPAHALSIGGGAG